MLLIWSAGFIIFYTRPYKGLLPLLKLSLILLMLLNLLRILKILILGSQSSVTRQQTSMEIGNPQDIIVFPLKIMVLDSMTRNFTVFSTSDTKHKKGGKGIGDSFFFLWLKAFDKVEISSHFRKNGSIVKRDFSFELIPEGVKGGKEAKPSEKPDPYTIVQLVGYKEKYREKSRRKPSVIAYRIIEHCLSFFMRKNSRPFYQLTRCKSISLNQLYNQNYAKDAQNISFILQKESFNLIGLRLTTGEELGTSASFMR